MHIRVRELTDIRAVAGEPTPDDLALLRGADFGGTGLEEADVRVRAMLLAHDQYDRTYERFPRAYLERFAETIVGKSVLPGHDRGALPLGRFFKGEVVRRREEFPSLTQGKALEGDGEKTAVETVPGFVPRQRTVNYLQAGFYYPNDEASAGLDNRIRTGVYRSVSIGFRFADLHCDVCRKSLFSDCPHYLGQELEDGKLLVTGTYAGDAEKAEALEGSFVFLGAQPGARLLKSMLDAGEIDVAKLAWTPYGEDLVALKEAEAFARRYGAKRAVWPVALDLPADAGETGEAAAAADPHPTDPPAAAPPTGDETMTEAEMTAAVEAAHAERDAALKAATDAAAAEAEAVTAKTAAEKALADAQPLLAIGSKALTDAAKVYVDHCKRLGQPEAQALAVAELFTSKQDYDGLKTMGEEQFAEVCKRFPATPAGRVLDNDSGAVRRYDAQRLIDLARA